MLVSKIWMVLLLILSPRTHITSHRNNYAVNAKVDVIVEFSHYCPFYKDCNTEPKNITDVEDAGCCQDCSCDTFCSPSGICCPHITHYLLETKHFNQSDPVIQLFSNQSDYKGFRPDRFYPCVMIDDLLNKARGLRNPITQRTALRVITDCPSINGSLKYPTCEVPETLEDFRMVVDYRGMVYKNEQCAKCHGVTHTHDWSLQPSCNWLRSQQFESFDELNAFILRFCKLESHPPLYNISNLAQCFSPVTPPMGVCFVSGDDGKFNTGKGAISGTSFTAILDNRAIKEKTRNEKCPSNELWDPYSANCRRLFCPPLMIPLLGQCVDMFKSYHGFGLQVLFKMVNWNDSFGIYDAHSLLTGLEDLHFVECIVCMADIELSRNNQGIEGFYLRIGFTSNELCSLNFILDVLRHASLTFINVEVYGISVKLELQLKEVFRKYSLFNLIKINSCTGGRSLTKGLLQQCPSIEVPNHMSDSKVQNVYTRDETGEEKKKVICVQDYKEFMEIQAETSGDSTNCPTIIYVLFMCCVLYDNLR